MMSQRPSGQFIAYGCFFIFLLCIFTSINEFRFESLSKFCRIPFPLCNYTTRSNSSNIENSSSNDIRIFMGVITLPSKYGRRQLLRLLYGTQSPVGAKIDVKFVFCNLREDNTSLTEDQKLLIALEIMRYDDIIILNCTESRWETDHKSYAYFTALPDMLNSSDGSDDPPYHYVAKADDDIYFRLQPLVDSLVNQPREDFYYGFVVPCERMDPYKRHSFMSGMGYFISWDIVEWIKSSDIPKKLPMHGAEDRVMGRWLEDGRRGKNRYNAKWAIYNYPGSPTKCAHELVPDTIAVHNLKTEKQWIHTMTYFNVTQNLKPSKFYSI
ncbi:hypothetical protein RHSIM_Rhsim03G0270800 [Rhododendron simsii]|uniref:Hexosyltransferase n=1 Tax=Rhododendron simsii TaxID=118357 RepID=A0A834H627_RHOSS|nr:hypothetical protein RHSIM_Rhsim03G0270800 [Rhododendron simsii]